MARLTAMATDTRQTARKKNRDLFVSALNYLRNAWTPVMAYRHDGRYSIDDSMAECAIRPLTIERKNKMAFGSHKDAETSTVYHTFIGICKMSALSFYQFLKNYLMIFMDGIIDFENLPYPLPYWAKRIKKSKL